VGFSKIYVEPGESQRATVTIDPSAANHPFGVWDYCTRGFVTPPGEFVVYVGNAADNAPHRHTIVV
jgi:beta-glucosidase